MGYIGNKNSVALYDSYTKAQADGIFQTPFAEIDVTSGATVNDLNGLYLLTGTLTSNVTFVVQDAQRQFTVVNSTSGAFTVTVKTAAGTGEPVPQGQARVLRSDGVDVVDGFQVDADQVLYDGAVLTATNADAAFDELSTANNAGTKAALNASGAAPIYACRAWVNFNGTLTVAIRASGNVSSVTDLAVGNYTVNFAAPMIDQNFVANLSVKFNSGGTNYAQVTCSEYRYAASRTTSYIRVNATSEGGGVLEIPADVETFQVSIHR